MRKCFELQRPYWKKITDQTYRCLRGRRVSASWGPYWGSPWIPSDYNSIIALRGLRDFLIRLSLCRETLVSRTADVIFFQSGHVHNISSWNSLLLLLKISSVIKQMFLLLNKDNTEYHVQTKVLQICSVVKEDTWICSVIRQMFLLLNICSVICLNMIFSIIFIQ